MARKSKWYRHLTGGLLRSTRRHAHRPWSLILPVLFIAEAAQAPRCLSGPLVDVTGHAPTPPAAQYTTPATQASEAYDFAPPILQEPDPVPSSPTTIVDSYGAKHLKRMFDQPLPQPLVASADAPPTSLVGDSPAIVADGFPPIPAAQIAPSDSTTSPPAVGAPPSNPPAVADSSAPAPAATESLGGIPPGDVPPSLVGQALPEPSALWILPCCLSLAISRHRFFWL